MNTIWAVESQRRTSGGSTDPAALRQRMIDDRGEESDQTSDYDLLEALHRMDDATRWQAMQQLPDADCERIVALIPLWRTIRGMSRDEIVRLLVSMK